MTSIDVAIVALYAVVLFGLAQWVSRDKGQDKTTEDYFLAGRALPWWAIGASLIAANISAEQIIGQSGQGFVVGLAIAAYEWQAASVLLIVAKYFLPIFLKREIYTMPQFLQTRYGTGVKSLMSFYWLALYTAVNLTALLWLGGGTIERLTGIDVFTAMSGLAAFAVLYSLYGGLKAVALTDIIQVVILILGGIAITWLALDAVGLGEGAIAGLQRLSDEVPGHFVMILDSSNPSYSDLPGIWTLLGGLWVLHFSYWGFNQYIIQRALGAESLAEAQKGLAFAAFLKLLIPLIVVVPGIAALVLAQDGMMSANALNDLSGEPDKTYGELMKLAPAGLRGLVFAALIAAIVSSLASMMNSIATIFTMDVYRQYVSSDRPESHFVMVGRVAAFSAIAVALILARPFYGGLESAFQTIQEYTGFIAPGVVAIFLLGFFYKRANEASAFAALITSVIANVALKILLPDLPFVLRIWIVFFLILIIGVLVSELSRPSSTKVLGVMMRVVEPSSDQPVDLSDVRFGTTQGFNVAAGIITLLLALIYVAFW
jgi:SSS family solute:Na+ symporter